MIRGVMHVIFSVLAVGAAFLCAGSNLAWAFERTHTCYPAQDGRTPVCRKGQKSIPIQWRDGCTTWRNHSEFPDEHLDAVHHSFQTWNDVSGSYFRAFYAGSTDQFGSGYDCKGGQSANENVVSFVEHWPESLAGSDVVALTSVVYSIDTGEILDADIRMNAEHFKWQTITHVTNDLSVVDVQNIMTHEVGHFLGLEHATEDNYLGRHRASDATMYANTFPNEIKRRVLDADDKAGVRAIYPVASAPSTPCEAPSPDHAALPKDFDGARFQCSAKRRGCRASVASEFPASSWLLLFFALYALRCRARRFRA